MFCLTKDCDHILPGFFLSTAAWIISSLSMGFKDWHMWKMKGPLLSYPRTVYVGIWEVCIYQHDINGSSVEWCHAYKHHVPWDIWICQYALIVCSILGVVSLVSSILIVTKLNLNKIKKNATDNPFTIPGFMNTLATTSVFVTVIINYNAVRKMKGIDLPSSFNLLFQLDTQHSGVALELADIGCFLFWLTICIFFTFPKDNQIHPENRK